MLGIDLQQILGRPAPAGASAGGISVSGGDPTGTVSAAPGLAAARPAATVSPGIAGAPPIPAAPITWPIAIDNTQAQLQPGDGVAPKPVGPVNLQPAAGPDADHMARLGQFHALMQQLSPGWGQ